MKTARILTILVMAIALSGASYAAPMGTAFTYQGHLYVEKNIEKGTSVSMY